MRVRKLRYIFFFLPPINPNFPYENMKRVERGSPQYKVEVRGVADVTLDLCLACSDGRRLWIFLRLIITEEFACSPQWESEIRLSILFQSSLNSLIYPFGETIFSSFDFPFLSVGMQIKKSSVFLFCFSFLSIHLFPSVSDFK